MNVRSRGRGLLALFLFSDVGPGQRAHPAGRRIASVRAAGPRPPPGKPAWPARGSRRRAAPVGAVPARRQGHRPAGDVYLCHPFIVHTATWPHRGTARG